MPSHQHHRPSDEPDNKQHNAAIEKWLGADEVIQLECPTAGHPGDAEEHERLREFATRPHGSV